MGVGNWLCNECSSDFPDKDTKTADVTYEPKKPVKNDISHQCKGCEKTLPTKLLMLKHCSQNHYNLYLSELVTEFFQDRVECGKCEKITDECSSTAQKLIHIGENHADYSKLINTMD